MILFKREFKRNFKSLLIWTIALGGTIFLLLSMYPEFAAKQGDMSEFLKSFPEGMLKAFNMDKISYGTMLGYYSVQGFMMVTLVGSIYVSILASNMLSKEENEKTIEFLLSKPITRWKITIQKFLTVVVNILIFNVILALITFAGFQIDKNSLVEFKTFMLLVVIAPVLLHMTFASMAFLASSIVRKSRNTLSLSMGLVLMAYFFNIMAGISDKYQALKYLSPFQYINTADIIIGREIKLVYIVIMLGIMSLCIGGSLFIYQRKDIAV